MWTIILLCIALKNRVFRQCLHRMAFQNTNSGPFFAFLAKTLFLCFKWPRISHIDTSLFQSLWQCRFDLVKFCLSHFFVTQSTYAWVTLLESLFARCKYNYAIRCTSTIYIPCVLDIWSFDRHWHTSTKYLKWRKKKETRETRHYCLSPKKTVDAV